MKRIFDLTAASVALVVLSPLLAALAILVAGGLGRPILFRQIRPGLNGTPFTLIKFRTMLDATDAEGRLLPDADRLTALGRFLRTSSLDELPELWNILKGDMSFVGPRPLLMDYLPLYSPEQARRHDVRPGLTGYAQTRGRNALTWPEKFALDIWYVENRTFLLDMRIILDTAVKVLKRDGISADGEATMPRFTGSADTP